MKQLILLLMLCISINAGAQPGGENAATQPTGEIFGTVVNRDGEDLAGVVITASSPSMAGDISATSTEYGNFIFRMLPTGDYTLTATRSGMKKEEIVIEVTMLKPARARIVLAPEKVEDELFQKL